jgi:mRNA-degrading endonuclease RelE of RelBE toxin-antitoxin system
LAYTYVVVVIVETRVFAKRVDDLLSTEEFRELQLDLVARPTAGPIVRGAGGLRKLRWSAVGRGKRGGVRIIYFYHPASARILLLFAFAKNERSDLTASQREKLRRIVESEYP